MSRSRRKRPNPEGIRAAQLEGARTRLRDLLRHRPDLDDDEREALIVETIDRIAELEGE